MSQFTHDVCHGVEYQASDGTTKKRYTKIGAAFTSDQGKISIKLEYVPVASGPVWLSLMEPRPKQ